MVLQTAGQRHMSIATSLLVEVAPGETTLIAEGTALLERSRRRRSSAHADGALLETEQRREADQYLVDESGRRTPDWIGAAGMPVDAAKMVDEDHAGDRQSGRQLNLEGVALDLTGDRTGEGKPGTAVVRGWRQHQSRPTTSLLAASLGVERQPDQVTTVRDVWVAWLP
jgi:hypothetical protein